ncbi:hypothetical protein JOS77_30650 [Chromobacterium haemolyticum]|nr:hypothetical protein JOS77_30650 [Chromobacterium haemolyticum]
MPALANYNFGKMGAQAPIFLESFIMNISPKIYKLLATFFIYTIAIYPRLAHSEDYDAVYSYVNKMKGNENFYSICSEIKVDGSSKQYCHLKEHPIYGFLVCFENAGCSKEIENEIQALSSLDEIGVDIIGFYGEILKNLPCPNGKGECDGFVVENTDGALVKISEAMIGLNDCKNEEVVNEFVKNTYKTSIYFGAIRSLPQEAKLKYQTH